MAGARSIVELLRMGVLDAELAALVWLLVERRVPVLVAGIEPPSKQREQPAGTGALRVNRRALLEALLDFLAPDTRRISIRQPGVLEQLTAADTETACLVDLDLTEAPMPHVRLAFRSLSRGAQLAASLVGDSLEDVFARLRKPDLHLSDDELTFLGVVVVLRSVEGLAGSPAPPPRDRVVVAHYVRPLARDQSGHVQRMGPAVLVAWDARTDTFEQFAWGILAELASRTGIRAGDLDAELDRRRDYLAGLAAAGLERPGDLRVALEGFRRSNDMAAGH